MKKQIKKILTFNMVITGLVFLGLGIVGSNLIYKGIMANQVSKFAYGLTCAIVDAIVAMYFVYLDELRKH